MVRYEEIAEAALGGKAGRTAVSFIMYTELIGTCALFLILESDNVWNLLGDALKGVAASLGTQAGELQHLLGTQRGIFWVCAMAIVPTVLAPNVKALSVLGIVGFAATMTVTAAIAWTFLTGVVFLLPCSMPPVARIWRASFWGFVTNSKMDAVQSELCRSLRKWHINLTIILQLVVGKSYALCMHMSECYQSAFTYLTVPKVLYDG